MSKGPPNRMPRCSCLAPSQWAYDDMLDEWSETLCWRCLEIEVLKGDQIAKAIQPWDTDMIDKFIDLVADKDTLTGVVRVIEFKK